MGAIALLLIVLGILAVFGGCSVATVNHGGWLMVWLGVALILAGWLLDSRASSKTCPHCQERINKKAVKCKHCQSALAAH